MTVQRCMSVLIAIGVTLLANLVFKFFSRENTFRVSVNISLIFLTLVVFLSITIKKPIPVYIVGVTFFLLFFVSTLIFRIEISGHFFIVRYGFFHKDIVVDIMEIEKVTFDTEGDTEGGNRLMIYLEMKDLSRVRFQAFHTGKKRMMQQLKRINPEIVVPARFLINIVFEVMFFMFCVLTLQSFVFFLIS